jgi:hypothetical protein
MHGLAFKALHTLPPVALLPYVLCVFHRVQRFESTVTTKTPQKL